MPNRPGEAGETRRGISARGLRHAFGRTTALGGVDLEVGAGETVALVGPSGSGKSTLLRCLLGLTLPDVGTVTLNGERLEQTDLRRQRHGVGYVVQGGGLFPHLTARENVGLLAKELRWPSARISERIETLRPLVQLAPENLDRRPGQLSGGQAQRVSLMRALMLDPPLLFLDEPLGALDPVTRYRLQGELKEIFARLRKTVVLVTHDLAEAAFLASRLVLLREGKVEQEGSLEELIERPASPFVTEFVRAHRSLPGIGEP